ncbi:cell adhesion molecule CEACAM5 [Genypterus blacodes]|uniref:cell adhesion molecule CEACAM5 n=1 Tax=Genypterus blacodes TaxID=154954 RepID=UPI003F75FB4C
MKSLLFLFSVIGCCAGQNALPDGPVDALLGKHVTLETLVNLKGGFLAVIWTFKSQSHSDLEPVVTLTGQGPNVDEAFQGKVAVNSTNGFLTLGPLQAKHSGEYMVSIVFANGSSLTGDTVLRVLEPVSDVTIKPNMAEAIELNSTVVLTCTAKGSFLKFSWSKGPTPIVTKDRISLKEAESSSTLTIKDVLRSDLNAPIVCLAANKIEQQKSAPLSVPVHYGPDKVSITSATVSKYIRSGSNLKLICSSESSPAATISWYHNAALQATKGPELSLSSLKEKQGGNYSCHAHNAKTLRTVASAVISFTVQDAISGVSITGPTVLLIAGNHTANLSCQAKAGTVTMRSWLKDGRPLATSDRVVVTDDKTTVMIRTVQKEDNGEYKCELTNAIGMDSAAYKMVVNFGPEPVALSGSDAVEVKDSVKLQCSSVSVPAASYIWKFNGTLMGVKTAEYTIEHAVFKNSGLYTCQAYNAVTGKTATSSHTLSVKGEGEMDDGLTDGAIAGIVIGVLVALGLVIGLLMCCRRKDPIESPY